jgi:hypothetical protein
MKIVLTIFLLMPVLLSARDKVKYKPCKVSGEVIDTAGNLLKGAVINVYQGRTLIQTIHAKDGTYSINNLQTGRWDIEASKNGDTILLTGVICLPSKPSRLDFILTNKTRHCEMAYKMPHRNELGRQLTIKCLHD